MGYRTVLTLTGSTEREDLDRSGVWFDLAAVIDEDTTPENCEKLRMRVAEIGFDRVLFASDWDGYRPKTYMETARDCLRLDLRAR